MSTSKTLLTFITGIASGLAIAYYADPKGSKKKLQKIEKEIGKTRKTVDKKLSGYKGTYNELLDKYADRSKDLIDQAKGMVDGVRKTAKSEN